MLFLSLHPYTMVGDEVEPAVIWYGWPVMGILRSEGLTRGAAVVGYGGGGTDADGKPWKSGSGGKAASADEKSGLGRMLHSGSSYGSY